MVTRNPVGRFLGAIWRALDVLRRALHLVVLLVLVLIVLAVLAPDLPLVAQSSALVLA